MNAALARTAGCVLASCLLVACGGRADSTASGSNPAEPSKLRVVDVTVGKSVNPDRTIGERTSTFEPTDTIYISMKTEGTAQGALLQTRWSFQGRVVEESTERIVTDGPAVTEFHLRKPDGWPTGNYTIEVLLNGVAVGSETFSVTGA